jgi:hypothetical protein
MNAAELRALLAKEGFDPDVYSIDGGLPPYEGLLLEPSGTAWTIDHVERGIRRPLESFSSEDEACRRMYELLSRHFR